MLSTRRSICIFKVFYLLYIFNDLELRKVLQAFSPLVKPFKTIRISWIRKEPEKKAEIPRKGLNNQELVR